MNTLLPISDIFSNSCSFWLAVIVGVLTLLYIWGTYRYNQFKGLTNVPQPWAFPFLGHLMFMMKDGTRKYDKKIIEKYGKYVGQYIGSLPHILTTDTELIKQVYVKEAGSFLDRRNLGVNGYPLRRAITLLTGDDWKRVRSLITPTFTSNKMRKVAPLITQSVQTLTEIFEKYADEQTDIPIKEVFGNLTMEVIARTMFAMDIHIQNDPQNIFTRHAKRAFNINPLRNPLFLVALALPKLAPLIIKFKPGGFMPNDTNEFFINMCKKSMEERRDNVENDHDLLALMMKAHSEELENQQEKDWSEGKERHGDWTSNSASASRGLTNEEIMAQAMIFMLAGYETTASTLHFCCYYLAMNPETQERCFQEIKREIGNEALNYDNANKLVFLDQCIQETLRLASPATRIERVATEDVVLTRENGEPLLVKKGMSIQVPITVMHSDPDVWEEPEKFNPDRFSQEEKERRNQYTYAPFGIGPRNCVGMRFANLEMRMSLASVIRAVRFVPCEKTQKTIVFNKFGLTMPVDPIILRCEKRS